MYKTKNCKNMLPIKSAFWPNNENIDLSRVGIDPIIIPLIYQGDEWILTLLPECRHLRFSTQKILSKQQTFSLKYLILEGNWLWDSAVQCVGNHQGHTGKYFTKVIQENILPSFIKPGRYPPKNGIFWEFFPSVGPLPLFWKNFPKIPF